METHKPLLKDTDGEDVDEHLYRSMIRSLMYLTSSRPDIMFAVCAYARFQVNPKSAHLHDVKRIFRYLKGQPKSGLWYPKDSPFDLVAYTDSYYAVASLDRKSTTGVKNPVFHSKTKHIEIRHHFIRYSNEKKLIQMIKIHTDKNIVDLLTKAFDDTEPPDVEVFFDFEPDTGVLTTKVVKGSSEHYVLMPNILPTLPTLDPDLDFTPSHDSLGSGNKIFNPGIFIKVQTERLLSRDEFSISFIRDPLSPVFDTLLPFSSENEDKVFKPGILSYLLVSHRDKITSEFSKNPMMMYGGDILFLDVPYLHFYPP
ncbi:hypothetical protein Tco_0706331 [Tanacetum coccineum]|uniref:Reverse transcriptase Ty1/copia-type domain-containing protein n=1 Tax=Tanacetum coccineum TaxID=301880 RepID=A0ABQ4Y7Z5_9ASTR